MGHLFGLSRADEVLTGDGFCVLSLVVGGYLGHFPVPFLLALEVVAGPQVVLWFLLKPLAGSGLSP